MVSTARRGEPTPPIALADGEVRDHLRAQRVEVDDALSARLRGACASVVTDERTLAEASRDWWPLAMHWARAGQVGARGAVLVQPASAAEVSAVLRLCNEARVPVTTVAGRSGVCGASVPVHGGVLLDMTRVAGIRAVDRTSRLVDVLPGTF